jgi:glutathione S-transferase
VPTLVAEDGTVLFESGLICEYLTLLNGAASLFPHPGPERWRALRLQGLADGAATAAGRLYADEHRPAEQTSEAMMERFRTAIFAVLSALERENLRTDHSTIGEVAVGVFLGYLDFRWPDRDWRIGRMATSEWFAAFDQRPSMTTTRHQPLSV